MVVVADTNGAWYQLGAGGVVGCVRVGAGVVLVDGQRAAWVERGEDVMTRVRVAHKLSVLWWSTDGLSEKGREHALQMYE